MPTPARLSHPRARLYEVVRTAHLERARELAPASIVYRRRRYDFDPSVAPGVELVQAEPMAAARLLVRSGVTALEVNEPLQLSSAIATLSTLLALDLRGRLRGTRPLVVTYAIENLDPMSARPARLRSRLKLRAQRWAAGRVWRRLDRIVYGTTGARDLHARVLPLRPDLESTVIEALPAPMPARSEVVRDPLQIVFLGALVGRKGFPLLVDAWSTVLQREPRACLVILGSGELEPAAAALSDRHPSVTFHRDPARSVIFDTLAASRTLVLPSQPRPDWREQVGLPIVEGLAAGCLVVTTTETGIAGWLDEHGHRVVEPGDDAVALAEAILATIASTRTPEDVLADLPARDGRLAADTWLFRDAGGDR